MLLHRGLKFIGFHCIFIFSVTGWSAYCDDIYIAPNSRDCPGTGSITQPFCSWSNVDFKKGNTYRQKAGTVSKVGVRVNKSGTRQNRIVLASYGVGPKPIIAPEIGRVSIAIGRDKKFITIDGLEVWGSSESTGAVVGIKNTTYESSPAVLTAIIIKNSTIRNVLGFGRYRSNAIDLRGEQNQVTGNTITNVANDGIWIDGKSSVVSENIVSKVSQRENSGDCIQFGNNSPDFIAKNNDCHHEDRDVKQCFVVSGGKKGGLFSGNKCFAPTDASDCQGFLIDNNNVVVVGNLVVGGETAITSGKHGRGLLIASNIMIEPTSFGIDVKRPDIVVVNNTIFGKRKKWLAAIRSNVMEGSIIENNAIVDFDVGISLNAKNSFEGNNGFQGVRIHVRDVKTKKVLRARNPAFGPFFFLRSGPYVYVLKENSPLAGRGVSKRFDYLDYFGRMYKDPPAIGAVERP